MACINTGRNFIDFYPRPPRGGRRWSALDILALDDFYPRPPRGGRRAYKPKDAGLLIFLSTSSARRTTLADSAQSGAASIFLSTSSARRTTPALIWSVARMRISIHVLREEDDRRWPKSWPAHRYFYPRPPRGGRPGSTGRPSRTITLFLSTSSARRTTPPMPRRRRTPSNFYPRPPRGGRRSIFTGRAVTTVFLSTSSARRTT